VLETTKTELELEDIKQKLQTCDISEIGTHTVKHVMKKLC